MLCYHLPITTSGRQLILVIWRFTKMVPQEQFAEPKSSLWTKIIIMTIMYCSHHDFSPAIKLCAERNLGGDSHDAMQSWRAPNDRGRKTAPGGMLPSPSMWLSPCMHGSKTILLGPDMVYTQTPTEDIPINPRGSWPNLANKSPTSFWARWECSRAPGCLRSS